MKQAKAGKSKVYFYLFTFEGRISEAMAFGMTPIKGNNLKKKCTSVI